MFGINRGGNSETVAGIIATIGIVLALAIAWGLGSLGHEPERPNQRREAHSQIVEAAPPLSSAREPESAEYQRPCGQGDDNRQSDLCAQWKAADAARDAADYAWKQFVIAGLGMGGLILTLALTYGALKATQKGVGLAEETAKKQLRAYLDVVWVKAKKFEVGQKFRVTLKAGNSGQTPASDVRVRLRCILTNVTPTFRPPEGEVDSMGVVRSGGNAYARGSPPAVLQQIHIDSVKAGTAHIWVFGVISYRDVFGDPHHSHFRQRSVINHKGKVQFQLCAEGNESD